MSSRIIKTNLLFATILKVKVTYLISILSVLIYISQLRVIQSFGKVCFGGFCALCQHQQFTDIELYFDIHSLIIFFISWSLFFLILKFFYTSFGKHMIMPVTKRVII